MNEEPRAIQSSVWAIRFALFSAALLAATIISHRIFGMPTPLALNLFMLAFVGCVVVLVIALFALIRIWQRGWVGSSNAVTAITIAIAMVLWPVSLLPTLRRLPVINDVTTDPAHPPRFIAAMAQRAAGANSLNYPGDTFASKQREGYGNLAPLRVDRPPSVALEAASQALRRLGMKILGIIPIGSLPSGGGQVEAVDRTFVIGFYDDIVVRVRPAQGGAIVDVRSASRFGRTDFGRNAMRIRDVLQEIIIRVEAIVPAVARPRDRLVGKRAPAAAKQ